MRAPLGLRIVGAALLLWPLMELLFGIWVARQFGGLTLIGLLAASFILGVLLLTSTRRSAMQLSPIAVIVRRSVGVLLILPGLIKSAIALLLLVPSLGGKAVRAVPLQDEWFIPRGRSGGSAGSSPRDSVIQGEVIDESSPGRSNPTGVQIEAEVRDLDD